MSLDKIITSQSLILKEQSPSNTLDINFVMYYDINSLNHSVTSVAQSCLTLWPHGQQYSRLLCPSSTPGACSNSHPSYPLCPLLLLPSVFSSNRVFPRSQFFTSGDQSIGASASASVLPMNIQDWFPLRLTDLISLQL